ncbi:NACHT domain-containing protein, partial [Cuspidothrix issatschenkoi]
MNKQRRRGFSVKPEGRILIEQKMRDKGYNRDKLAEVAEISIDTINSLLRGDNKERKTIEAVARALDIQLTDIVDASELYPQVENITKDDININWVQVCHKMLEEQQEQQRIRRKASAMGYEVNVHVPLGLVERKQQQRRNENVERKEIYQLEPEVITKTYQHQDFLQEVINKGYQGKNKHIAIVGEPGAGKTTLLNAIASDIKDKNHKLPIFISLGSLQGMTLADYILKKWLPDAIRLINIVPTSEIEAQLQTEFYQGNFYLLLDGVDEMGESSSIQALNKIYQELTNWLGQARVILTCRLNVWDATVTNNILPGFNTFKTQEFNPEQVNTFIAEWFQVANNINGGEKLIAQLQEEGKERIRELVTNPLRLCLLCQIFDQNDQGELPETKAQFYEIFTRYFYEWKPELVPDLIKSYELKQELHEALGKLALAGINSDLRFRLKRSFAVKTMGDEKLFNLACEVGWLNQVDRDAVNDEDVYAFFHPNFQEYFAALVIDDWRYFLNHVSDNPDEGIYRVFEPKWKEVMLMWIGRNDIQTEDKEFFMNTLIDFTDNCNSMCGYFYYEIPDFLGGLLIVEFPDFSRSYEIVENIVEYSFGYFDNPTQEWIYFPYFIAKKAKDVLKLIHKSHVSNAIIIRIKIVLELIKNEYFDQQKSTELFFDMFWTLNKFDPNHYYVINRLIFWIEEGKSWNNYHNDHDNPKTFPYDEITISNPYIVDKLSEMLIQSYNCIVDKRNKEKMKKEIEKIEKEQLKKENTYGKIIIRQDYEDYGNDYYKLGEAHLEYLREEDERLNNLVGLNENTIKIASIFYNIATTLTRISYKDENIFNLFVSIIKQECNDPNFDHDFCLNLFVNIGNFESNKEELLNFINEKLMNNLIENHLRCCLTECLLKLEPQNNLAINILIESLANIKDDKNRLQIVSILIDLNINSQEILNTLVQLLYDKKITNSAKSSYQNFDNSIFNLLYKDTCEKAISYLTKIAYYSDDARIVLDDIFQNSKYVILQENAAWQILEIEPYNHIALNFLLERYKDKSDDNSYQYFSREKFIDCLDKHPELTKNLLNVLSNCQDVTISTLIIDILGIINDEKYQLEIIKVLLAIIKYAYDENIIYEIALIIGGLNAINTAGNEQYKLEVVQILNQILNNTLNEDIICVAATSLSIIDTQNINVINILLSLLNKKTSGRTDYWLRQRMPIIASQNINIINELMYRLN